MENDAMSSQYLTLSASFMYHPVMLYSVRYFYPSLPSLRGTKTLLSSMRARARGSQGWPRNRQVWPAA